MGIWIWSFDGLRLNTSLTLSLLAPLASFNSLIHLRKHVTDYARQNDFIHNTKNRLAQKKKKRKLKKSLPS